MQFTYYHAMEIVKDCIQPGEPTLGDWFGWNQPKDDDMVKLGTIYGRPKEFTLREVLTGTELGFEQASQLLRNHDFYLDEPIICNCLLNCDEVFIPFSTLDEEEQQLFHLKVMVINTYTAAHNWACEWGDAMAEWRWQVHGAQLSDWEMYEHDHKRRHESDLVADLLFYNVKLPIAVWEDSDFITPKGSAGAREYAEEHYPFEGRQWYEVLDLLSWILDWLVREHEAGNLTINWEVALGGSNAAI